MGAGEPGASPPSQLHQQSYTNGMVLQDLGRRLNQAIQSVNGQSTIDEQASRPSQFAPSHRLYIFPAPLLTAGARPQALDAVLKSVCAALLESDVNVLLVKRCRDRVKAAVLPQLEEMQAKQGQGADAMQGNKAKQLIHKAIFDELVALVDPGDAAPPAFNASALPPALSMWSQLTRRDAQQPVKGKSQVIMMVGLQGAGKTTTCTKVRSLSPCRTCSSAKLTFTPFPITSLRRTTSDEA